MNQLEIPFDIFAANNYTGGYYYITNPRNYTSQLNVEQFHLSEISKYKIDNISKVEVLTFLNKPIELKFICHPDNGLNTLKIYWENFITFAHSNSSQNLHSMFQARLIITCESREFSRETKINTLLNEKSDSVTSFYIPLYKLKCTDR